MKGKFVGLKHVSGKTADGREFAFDNALFVTDLGERDVQKGAVGQDVHSVSVPKDMTAVCSEANVGKNVEVEFYYANKREQLRYCTILK